ncbi:unnamed protein product, partial [Discosporangium mesarthrocarpum]
MPLPRNLLRSRSEDKRSIKDSRGAETAAAGVDRSICSDEGTSDEGLRNGHAETGSGPEGRAGEPKTASMGDQEMSGIGDNDLEADFEPAAAGVLSAGGSTVAGRDISHSRSWTASSTFSSSSSAAAGGSVAPQGSPPRGLGSITKSLTANATSVAAAAVADVAASSAKIGSALKGLGGVGGGTSVRETDMPQ